MSTFVEVRMQLGANMKSAVDEVNHLKTAVPSISTSPSRFIAHNPSIQILAQQHMPHLHAQESEIIETYERRLTILKLSANALSSFMFVNSSNTLIMDGDKDALADIEYHGVCRHLTHSPGVLHLVEASITNGLNDFLKSGEYDLMAMLLVDDNKQAIALVGTLIPNSELSSAKSAKTSKTAKGFKNPKTKKIIKLLMHEFKRDLLNHAKSNQLHAIHSQHLQLSALNQDYICIKDSGHRIVYANPALLATYPASAQPKIFGYTTANFYDPDSCAKMINSDISALTSGYFKGTEYIKLANGTEKILLTTKKAFNGIDGKKYLMSVSRDITEKEILINDLKRSNADLDNFAYVASHDLRAPLNAIKRLVSYVKEDCESILPGESNEDLSIVLNRVNRMEKLLVDLLSYSRIGKEYQEATQFNLREFVIEMLSLIDLPMGFVFTCDNVDINVPEIPFNVVMINLVSNAIKHHDSGNAKIQIKAKNSEQGSVITVIDNGPGIEEKNRERIFKLFETLKPRDEVEGSGMGLSVVKKIVEHYGGNIKVASNKPRGTKFIVTWPTHNMARSVLDGLHKEN
jgi:nitrogen-specific signal transduction histidine kinase